MAVEIGRCRPQHDSCRRLVRPAEIAPQHTEVDFGQDDADHKKRHSNHQAFAQVALIRVQTVAVQEFGNLQTSGAEGGIAGGNRQHNDTKHSEDAAKGAKHAHRRIIDNFGRRASFDGFLQHLHIGVEADADHAPDQRNHAFGDHRAVENEAGFAFIFRTSCHHRRLRGVEAGNRAAGDGHKNQWPDGQFVAAFRLEVGEEIAKGNAVLQANRLEERNALKEQAEEHTGSHEHQQRAEERINTADDFVDGQQSRDDVVHEDDANPGQRQIVVQRIAFHHRFSAASQYLFGEAGEETGGTGDENDTDQHQQDEGDKVDDVLHRRADIAPSHGRYGSPAIADGDHAAEVIMHGAGKNAADNDPQHGDRAIKRAEDGSENRPGTGDIEYLNQPYLRA